DAPAVGTLSEGSTAADITDYYAFESPENSDNYVFVTNVMGLTAPGSTADAKFSEDIMYEINIDNNADDIEDLVIQAIFRDGKVIVFGPTSPSEAGIESKIENDGTRVESMVSAYGQTPEIGAASGMKVFAGPRDDSFYMDFFKFVDIVNGAGSALGLEVDPPANGSEYSTSFDDPGSDTFAGSNVMSVVIELPKSMLGSSTTFSSWVEAKVKK
ncbi:DUF4331 domain-containing protein, partial [Fulvivirga sp. RKSG066]|uniref:DUF4331 family protein n=1 Tax=Fulvivirga aurantia TaxID=2529383 RepID=UPI0012BCC0AB